MKIGIISKDKHMMDRIKAEFSMLSYQNVIFKTYKKIDEMNLSKLLVDDYRSIFIDIDIVDNGLSFGKEINEQYPNIDIVYMGSKADEFYKYSAVDTIGFIYKNDIESNLNSILLKIIKHIDEFESTYIKVHWKNTVFIVNNKHVLYIEREKRRTLVHTIYGEVYTTYQHLEEFSKKLEQGFLRVHFSYLINTAYVKEVHRNEIILMDGVIVPISRKYSLDVKNYYEGTEIE